MILSAFRSLVMLFVEYNETLLLAVVTATAIERGLIMAAYGSRDENIRCKYVGTRTREKSSPRGAESPIIFHTHPLPPC